MPKFGFDDSELAQLFADAGAAVNKARSSEPRKVEPTSTHSAGEPEISANQLTLPKNKINDSEQLFSAERQEKVTPPTQSILPGKNIHILSGALDSDGLNANTSEGGMVKIVFADIKALALGRVEQEQLIALKYGGSSFLISDKQINMKGMLPKMAFSAPENWRNLIAMLAERSGHKSDPGIQAVLTGGGLIPKYSGKEVLLEALK